MRHREEERKTARKGVERQREKEGYGREREGKSTGERERDSNSINKEILKHIENNHMI